MKNLVVESFGPLKKCNVEIGNLTVLVGNQGVGKSTIAKLYSSLVWLEKALFLGKKDINKKISKTYFMELLKFHQIDSYFTGNTIISYYGDFCRIFVKDSVVNAEKNKTSDLYCLPKIQYIPAERNLVSAIDKYENISYLSPNMQDFVEIYDAAVQSEKTSDLKLPIDNLKVKYDKRTRKVIVYNDSYSIPVGIAASGIQSMMPFIVVIKYLEKIVFNENKLSTLKNLAEKKSLNEQFLRVLGYIPEDVEHDENVRKNIQRLFDSCVVSILEEPEQNLFPNSQKTMMEDLLEFLNTSKENNLIITTHSPYILETINNCIYAAALSEKNIESNDILPSKQQISYSNVSAYKIHDGIAESIKIDELKQIDPAEIDSCSVSINEVYSKLSDREYENE